MLGYIHALKFKIEYEFFEPLFIFLGMTMIAKNIENFITFGL
jgi:hypothetical protein